MATHQIPILGAGTLPDTSGNVFFQPYTVEDTAAVIDPLVLVFVNVSAKIGIASTFTVPQNYVGSPSFEIIWTANNATTNNAVFDLSYLTRSGTEDMGAAATATTDTVTDAHTGTAFQRNQASISVTAGNFALGDQCLYELFRDGVADSLAADYLVFQVLFQYDDV